MSGARLYWDERCFWHDGPGYTLTMPAGGLVQPMPGGFPDGPETKRRLLNLVRASGLAGSLDMRGAEPASREQLLRVHTASYLDAFEALNAAGGELGPRAPFGPGGWDVARLSAGLAIEALRAVLTGEAPAAYALSRPPGHHCLPDTPNGFCLLANGAIAIEDAIASGLAGRVAVIDWDVHHGNGTEAIYAGRADVLAISIHQERNYPLDGGPASFRGTSAGEGATINIPLPAGAGHDAYLAVMDRIVVPALGRFGPDAVLVACGFDASAFDPLGRMLCSAATFDAMTARVMEAANDLCGGRLAMIHEGGYSEAYVPFCGHAVLRRLAGGGPDAPDPLAETVRARQPQGAHAAFLDAWVDDLARALG